MIELITHNFIHNVVALTVSRLFGILTWNDSFQYLQMAFKLLPPSHYIRPKKAISSGHYHHLVVVPLTGKLPPVIQRGHKRLYLIPLVCSDITVFGLESKALYLLSLYGTKGCNNFFYGSIAGANFVPRSGRSYFSFFSDIGLFHL